MNIYIFEKEGEVVKINAINYRIIYGNCFFDNDIDAC